MSEKIYKCKYCEEDNPDNFYKDRCSTCKKCRNKMTNGNFDKKIKDKVFDSIKLNEDSKILMEKFLSEPQKIFNCKSLKEIIEDVERDKITNKLILTENNKKIKDATNNQIRLIDVCNKLFSENQVLKTDNNTFKEENKKLEEKYNESKKENQEMKTEISKLKEIISQIIEIQGIKIK